MREIRGEREWEIKGERVVDKCEVEWGHREREGERMGKTVGRGGSRICEKGGRSGYRERRWREGFWRVPFEDPLWNFKRGGARPLRPPPPESASGRRQRKRERGRGGGVGDKEKKNGGDSRRECVRERI